MLVPRPRILMIAFACNPAGGGEHWLGWGWAEQAAKFCDVTLVSWDRFATHIQTHAQAAGIRTVCLGVPPIVKQIGDRSGAGRWLRQVIWHRRAARVAARLHAETPFDLVHQTTFHTFRIPFRAASWGIPAVWGPIAGGETTPPGFGPWLGRLRTIETIRPWTNKLALAQPAVRRSLRLASAIFVSNHTTMAFLPAWCSGRCQVIPPNTLRGEVSSPPERALNTDGPLRLLFVGNCVATRSIPLVLDALRRVPHVHWHFTIVGDGSALNDWKTIVAEGGLSSSVTFTGAVPQAEARRYYDAADVFVFPALRDSGGSGLLEAMTAGLAVICCDWGGPQEMLDEQSGIKVPVDTPETAIAGFAQALERLHRERPLLRTLGDAAFLRAKNEFSWTKKRRVLEETYGQLLLRRR